MLRAQPDLQTLVLGSSHGDFGFDPRHFPGAFNLCCRSQDLRHSLALYERIGPTLPGLRQLVIFYAVFSPGFQLEQVASEQAISAALRQVFSLDIPGASERMQGLMELARTLDGPDTLHEWPGHQGFMPLHGKPVLPSTLDPARRAADHLRGRTDDSAHVHLQRMLDLAQTWGHEVCIVIPPCRSDYRAAMRMQCADLFAPLRRLMAGLPPHQTPMLLDLFESALFPDSLFGDCDHLVPTAEGPGLLAQQVRAAFGAAATVTSGISCQNTAAAENLDVQTA